MPQFHRRRSLCAHKSSHVDDKNRKTNISNSRLTFSQRLKLKLLPYRMGLRKLSNNFLEAHYLVASSVVDLDRRLTMQERKLVAHTVMDMIRLVPFAIVAAAPGGLFAVMAMVKYTPSLLPTTFHMQPSKLDVLMEEPDSVKAQMDVELKRSLRSFGKSLHENQLRQNTKLQRLMKHVDGIYNSQALDQLAFSEFTEQDILDVLSDVQLEALASYFNRSYPSQFGTYYKYPILRYQLKRHASKISALDTLLMRQDICALSEAELLNACKDRGICRQTEDSAQPQKAYLCGELKAWVEQTHDKAMPVLLLAIIRLNQASSVDLD